MAGTAFLFAAHYLPSALTGHAPAEADLFLSLYQGKTAVVVFANLSFAAAVCLAFYHDAYLNKRHSIVLAALVALSSLFALFYSNTKNGLAICAVLLLCACVLLPGLRSRLLAVFQSKSRITLGLVALSLLALIVQAHLKNAPEWRTLVADMKVGTDIDHQQHWKDQQRFPPPKNDLGITVADSAYARTAWSVAGLRLLTEYPLGFGVLEQSFGALAVLEWRDFHPPSGKTRGSTHSGWLDFALAVGLPGILIVLLWMGLAWFRALGQNGHWANIVRLSIPSIGLTYLLAEVCTDHFIELLFFLLTLFSTLMHTEESR